MAAAAAGGCGRLRFGLACRDHGLVMPATPAGASAAERRVGFKPGPLRRTWCREALANPRITPVANPPR